MSPWKPLTFVRLCVPFCHLQAARQLNFAACGAFFSASRAWRRASTLTPFLRFVSGFLSVFFSAIGISLDGNECPREAISGERGIIRPARRPCLKDAAI